MFAAPEQFAEINRSSIDAALQFAKASFDAAERLLALNVTTGREALAEAARNARAMAEVKDVQELVALRAKFAEGSAEKVMGYSKSLYEAAQRSQAEISGIFEEQVAEMNKSVAQALDKAVKVAPAGTDVALSAIKSAIAASAAAIDSATKAAKQMASFTDASVKATTNATVAAVKTGRK
jgi:phasin family protein